jgi:HEAT repeat protein
MARRKKLKRLGCGSEDTQRMRIFIASRSRDPRYLRKLFAVLRRDKAEANRRHAVRALGNIGGAEAEGALLAVLNGERGLIVGDAAEALGRLKSKKALHRLKQLTSDEEHWVAQQATYALRNIRK